MNLTLMWQTPPPKLTLTTNQVHLWYADLSLPIEEVEKLTSILSEEEKLRASRFRFVKHKRRFIVARSVLRVILGNYLQIPPQQLTFDYNSRGKPSIPLKYNDYQLEFNISHSEELALYGFTLQNQIGVDLEYLRPFPDAENIAQRFFSPQEYQLLTSLSNEEKPQKFFQIWTAKEAYLKAIGVGLAGSLKEIQVLFNSDNSVNLYQETSGNMQDWFLLHFQPALDYVATLAVESNSDLDLLWWRWCFTNN